MRNYSKTGGRPGKPGYRTPSTFRYKSFLKNVKAKSIKNKPTNKYF